jgi:hypothetical protein
MSIFVDANGSLISSPASNQQCTNLGLDAKVSQSCTIPKQLRQWWSM